MRKVLSLGMWHKPFRSPRHMHTTPSVGCNEFMCRFFSIIKCKLLTPSILDVVVGLKGNGAAPDIEVKLDRDKDSSLRN